MVHKKLTVEENAHQQSVWWRALPFLYDRFVCTPVPSPIRICIQLTHTNEAGKSTACNASTLDFLVSSDEEVFVIRLELPVNEDQLGETARDKQQKAIASPEGPLLTSENNQHPIDAAGEFEQTRTVHRVCSSYTCLVVKTKGRNAC